MAFQFIHMEAFSKKGDSKGRTVSFVMSEARRDPAASVHVAKPSPPVVVYGSTIDEVEALHDAAAAVAMTAVKGGKPVNSGRITRRFTRSSRAIHSPWKRFEPIRQNSKRPKNGNGGQSAGFFPNMETI